MPGRARIAVVFPFSAAGGYPGARTPWHDRALPPRPAATPLGLLRLALTSVSAQTLEPDDVDVVVVAASDGDPDAVARVAGTAANVRVVEERPGLARGLNRGIAEARAEVVVIARHDVLLSPATLAAHLAAHEPDGAPVVAVGRELRLFHSLLFRDPETAEIDFDDVDALVRSGYPWLPKAIEYLELDQKPITRREVLERFPRLEYMAAQTAEYRALEQAFTAERAAYERYLWLGMRFGNSSLTLRTADLVGGFDEELDGDGGWFVDLDFGLRARAHEVPMRFVADASALAVYSGPGSATESRARSLAYLVSRWRTVDVGLVDAYLQRPEISLQDYVDGVAAAESAWTLGRGGEGR